MNRPEGQDGPDTEGIALAQGDLSINLFIVLLIILSVLTVAQVSSGNQGYRAPYFQGSADDTVGPPVLGWQPLLPAYPKLVLRGGRVYLVDLGPLAAAFAAGAPLDLGPDVSDTSMPLADDLDPAAHQVFVRLADATFPAALTGASLAMQDLGTETGTVFLDRFRETPKLDLIVYPDDVDRAVPLVDRLHATGVALRIIVMPKPDVFGFAQSGGDYGLEKSFK